MLITGHLNRYIRITRKICLFNTVFTDHWDRSQLTLAKSPVIGDAPAGRMVDEKN